LVGCGKMLYLCGMGLFDTEIQFESEYSKKQGSLLKRKSKKEAMFIKRLESLNEVLPTIKNGFDYHLVSCENFGSIELLHQMIETYNPTEIIITTWSYNKDFVELIKKHCETIDISIIVDRSMGTRKHSLFNQLKELSVKNKIIFKQHKGIHSKVTIIKTNNLSFSITGSANYSNNQRVEQFNISTGEYLYKFHKEWILKFL
jgi:hypothetical protein